MKSGLCVVFAALALGVAFGSTPTIRAQEGPVLTPLFGETKEEFEARKRVLLPRETRSDPTSLTFSADAQGHFAVEPTINGTRVRMLVDTGASVVTLSRNDAGRLGIRPSANDFLAKVSTANGVVLVAPVVLREIAIGAISVRNVQAVVFPDDRLQVSLLGMSFLAKLSHFEVSSGKLVLKR
jgi:aspartyl protease family protein